MSIVAHKIRLAPTGPQIEQLKQLLETARLAWNWALRERPIAAQMASALHDGKPVPGLPPRGKGGRVAKEGSTPTSVALLGRQWTAEKKAGEGK
jgi:hypothetical protein